MTTRRESYVMPEPWTHPQVFPYLVTGLVSILYHVIILPDVRHERLISAAASQYEANNLPTWLVLASDSAVRFASGRQCSLSSVIPSGGFLISGRIMPTHEVARWVATDPTYAVRTAMLAEGIESHPVSGGILGDITKGGRQASAEDLARLGGFSADAPGVPKGLLLCPVCHQYRGECLDPSPVFQSRVMTVRCLCDNTNMCARCGDHLYQRKLNANYYNPADGSIWHVPGFSALSHQCTAGDHIVS
jgi:hypothetical protein